MDKKITGDLSDGAKYAEGCQRSAANSMHMEPPKGPVPEKAKLNGVKPPKEKNIDMGHEREEKRMRY
jgi:hypothetical protein